MNTARWAALALAVLAIPHPAGASPVPGRCTLPEPVLEYEAGEISVTLAVDYTACGWWDRRAVRLSAELERHALVSPVVEGTAAAKVCLGDGVRYPNGRTLIPRVAYCALEVRMSHPEIEVATYSGSFQLLWRDGPRQVTFSYDCHSTPVRTACEQ